MTSKLYKNFEPYWSVISWNPGTTCGSPSVWVDSEEKEKEIKE